MSMYEYNGFSPAIYRSEKPTAGLEKITDHQWCVSSSALKSKHVLKGKDTGNTALLRASMKKRLPRQPFLLYKSHHFFM
jgi:hypothetical protein